MEDGANRWWENYLVRYLMPSIAGTIIVLSLTDGKPLRSLLVLPLDATKIDATGAVLAFVYGNLFCYIASYPILVFHATRVLDFADGSGRSKPWIPLPYLYTVGLGIYVVLHFSLGWQSSLFVALLLAGLFSSYQIVRIYRVMFGYLIFKKWSTETGQLQCQSR